MSDRLVVRPSRAARAKLRRARRGRVVLRGRVEQLDGSATHRSTR